LTIRPFCRFAALLLSLAIALSFSACSPKNDGSGASADATLNTEAAETAAVTASAQASATPDTTASSVKLKKVEGTASLTNDSGKTLTILENMPLFRGYNVGTEDESFAYIALDDYKALKLDMLSAAEIAQTGSDLEVLLKAGNLFFNVTKPLEDGETLNITTSTIAMGIRGTSGVVKSGVGGDVVYILDGSVTLTVSASGETVTVAAGNKAEISETVTLSPLSAAEIDEFAAAEIRSDETLQAKIADATELDVDAIVNPPDPDAWQNIYLTVMHNAQNYAGSNPGYNPDSRLPIYLEWFELADINFDGTPELFIYGNGAGADSRAFIYTVVNGSAEYIFSGWGAHDNGRKLLRKSSDGTPAYRLSGMNGEEGDYSGYWALTDGNSPLDANFEQNVKLSRWHRTFDTGDNGYGQNLVEEVDGYAQNISVYGISDYERDFYAEYEETAYTPAKLQGSWGTVYTDADMQAFLDSYVPELR
jgi:hypothetical protein